MPRTTRIRYRLARTFSRVDWWLWCTVARRIPSATQREYLKRLRRELAGAGVQLRSGPKADIQLAELRALYEPYAMALADYLMLPLPAWLPHSDASDDWQRSAADQPAPRYAHTSGDRSSS